MNSFARRLRLQARRRARRRIAGLDARGQFAKALAAARSLALRGHPDDIFELSERLLAGRGTTPDLSEGLRLLRRTAELGHVGAAARLGEVYFHGPGNAYGMQAGAPAAAAGLAERLGLLLTVEADPEEARKWNEIAANDGDVGAHLRFAYALAAGLGGPRDTDLARRHYEAAAEMGSEHAEFALGELALSDGSDPGRHLCASKRFERAIAKGHVGAKASLAAILIDGPLQLRDPARGAGLAREAAEGGDPRAQQIWAECLKRGIGTEPDRAAAESWFRRAAARDLLARTRLAAFLLEEPDGPSGSEAIALLKDAADAGVRDADHILGLAYLAGTGVAADPRSAFRHISRAAEAGAAGAMERLGAMLADGQGTAADPVAARAWFEAAAEAGDLTALTNLGLAFETGLFGAPDYAEARARYLSAAERGSPAAAWRVGRLFMRGLGGPKDPDAAFRNYAQAAEGGVYQGAVELAEGLIARGASGDADAASRGMRILLKAAREGSVEAMLGLFGALSGNGLGRSDPRAARTWLERAADAGSLEAVLRLTEASGQAEITAPERARILERLIAQAGAGQAKAAEKLSEVLGLGSLGPRDPDGAQLWLRKAAALGSPDAMAAIADGLEQGRLEPAAEGESARDWRLKAAVAGHKPLLKAISIERITSGTANATIIDDIGVRAPWVRLAQAGDPEAQRVLGEFYRDGIGGEASDLLSAGWLASATALGDALAATAYAVLALQARVPGGPSPEEAVGLLERAAGSGVPDAQVNLAVCRLSGLGCAVDVPAARALLVAAAAAGHPQAAARLEAIDQASSPAQGS